MTEEQKQQRIVELEGRKKHERIAGRAHFNSVPTSSAGCATLATRLAARHRCYYYIVK